METNRDFIEWKPPYGLYKMIRLDFKANQNNLKGKLIMLLFRLASFIRRGNLLLRIVGVLYLVFYKIAVEWVLGVELPPLTRVGCSLSLHHGQGLVVNNRTIIGSNCILRHGITLGNKNEVDVYDCPIIGDNVNFGANSMVLGKVVIGSDAVIGAAALVIKDVPSRVVMVSSLANQITRKELSPS